MAKPELKLEAVRLRVQERKSFDEILKLIPVSRGILSLWLKSYPLSTAELKERKGKVDTSHPKPRGVESDLSKLVKSIGVEQSTTWKGRVSEAAVLLRLVTRGFDVLRPVFEGDCVDWFVRLPSRSIVKLQVKWTQLGTYGLPFASLEKTSNGSKPKRKKYPDGAIDFVVGYDLFTDTAYVWSWSEVKGHSAITINPDAAERWDKLIGM
jgi:transposase-like protein